MQDLKRLYYAILFTFLSLAGCHSIDPTSIKFETQVFHLNNPSDSLAYLDWQATHLPGFMQLDKWPKTEPHSFLMDQKFHSDDQFTVYGNCAGEFGGSLLFQDNSQPDSVYYLESTCPVMVDKRPDGYYITEALMHGGGFGKVLFVADPRTLFCVHLDSLSTGWKARYFPDLSYYEAGSLLSDQGTTLLDTNAFTFNLCLPHQSNNYLIYSDRDQTYVGRLTIGQLETIDTLLPFPTWTHPNRPNQIINGYYHYHFDQDSGFNSKHPPPIPPPSGDIFAKGDSIVIAWR